MKLSKRDLEWMEEVRKNIGSAARAEVAEFAAACSEQARIYRRVAAILKHADSPEAMAWNCDRAGGFSPRN